MTNLKTDEALLQALHKTSPRKPTHDELRKQRVSFIMGSLKPDSSITRSRVQEVLAEQEGKSG